MNLSFLLIFGALFSIISFILALLIVRKVFDDEYKRPWFFISLGMLIYSPTQILRYLNDAGYLIESAVSFIYAFELIAHGLLMYGLLVEFFILRYIKGKFVKMRFTPVQEGSMDGILPIDVTKGHSYLAYKKDSKYMLNVFSQAVKKGYEGFLITQQYPLNLRGEYGLIQTPILMITNPESSVVNSVIDENAQSVDALHFSSIINDIDNYLEQAKNPFIMMQIDEILQYNPFNIVLELLEYLKAKNSRYESILILQINTDIV